MDDHCKVSRWQLLKSQLNNLEPGTFWQKYKAVPDAVLIDCRKAEEFCQGKLEGAINIDYLDYDFWDKIERLDPSKTYFVYCRSGRRSLRACTLMRNGGFQQIFNLDGGLNIWLQERGDGEIV